MGNVPFGRGHILRNPAAHADDLDLLVGAARRFSRRAIALPLSVEQIGIEVGMADMIARRLHLRKVDTQILRTGADGGRGEDGG